MAEPTVMDVQHQPVEVEEEQMHVEHEPPNDHHQQIIDVGGEVPYHAGQQTYGTIQNSSAVHNLPHPDPLLDDPADFIDVVATDTPSKITQDNNVIRVIQPARPSQQLNSNNVISLDDDDDEGQILQALRKAREPPRIVRRVFVRRDPTTGSLLVDKSNVAAQPTPQAPAKPVSPAAKLAAKSLPVATLPVVTDEECTRAAEAIKEFTSNLKTLKLTTEQKDAILLHAGSLVDKLITITKETKDREAQRRMEDDRSWLRNEIDAIIEKRLGQVRVSQGRQFWRNETEKLTEVALTDLLVYRERGTRKQDVLTSALAGFNITYIQAHKNGAEVISSIRKKREKFLEDTRACRAFVDVCAEFLMQNCFDRHFPCNAEKYALLRHVENLFDIKLNYGFFTLENGTGKLDRRIRTIRTTSYKKGGEIKRKRKPLGSRLKSEENSRLADESRGSESRDDGREDGEDEEEEDERVELPKEDGDENLEQEDREEDAGDENKQQQQNKAVGKPDEKAKAKTGGGVQQKTDAAKPTPPTRVGQKRQTASASMPATRVSEGRYSRRLRGSDANTSTSAKNSTPTATKTPATRFSARRAKSVRGSPYAKPETESTTKSKEELNASKAEAPKE